MWWTGVSLLSTKDWVESVWHRRITNAKAGGLWSGESVVLLLCWHSGIAGGASTRTSIAWVGEFVTALLCWAAVDILAWAMRCAFGRTNWPASGGGTLRRYIVVGRSRGGQNACNWGCLWGVVRWLKKRMLPQDLWTPGVRFGWRPIRLY